LPSGAPAAEVGAKLWLDAEGHQDYYVLFADAVLLHKPSGRPTIIEVKTTKRTGTVAPYYTNSPQSVLYSLPLPYLFPQFTEHSWNTVYLVNQVTNTWAGNVELLDIEHSYEERLSTLMALMLRYEYICRMRELSFFPKTSSGECVSFFDICEFYGVCDSMALTCSHQTIDEQNRMDDEREGQVVIELHLQELLTTEMGRAA
jgi:hypothetical protein